MGRHCTSPSYQARQLWPNCRTLLAGSVRFTMADSRSKRDFDYSGVIADFSSDLEPEWEHFLALSALQGIPVYHVKQFNESITGRVAVDHLRENTLGAVVPSLIYPQFKRVIDFLAALLFLPFVAPMVGICAILIKLETPGPIFYRQRRTGFGGRPFTIFKLRTMTHNHDGGDYTLRRRRADYPGGAVLAPVSSRRAAANHQYSARGHELDRPSPGGDVARANGTSVKSPSTSIATLYGLASPAGRRCTKAMLPRSMPPG